MTGEPTHTASEMPMVQAELCSYSTIVLYSRDHKGVGMAHEITSPKNQPQFFPDNNEVVLVK